jgi:hypothetical protein
MPSLSKVGSEMLDGALPAISGASLTNLDARDLENALPAISGASLTGISSTTPPEACYFHTTANHVYNITGQGENYTCAYDSEISDVGSNYNNSTYTFTAPATGTYMMSVQIMMHGLEAGTTDGILISFHTSNRIYYTQEDGSDLRYTEWIGGRSWFVDMDASDTAHVVITVRGQSAVNADFKNGSYFSGFRVT